MVKWDFIVENIIFQAKDLSCLFYKSWEVYMRKVAWSKFFFKISLEVKLHFITTMFHYNLGWLVHDWDNIDNEVLN